jgi:hypothetical protein
MRRSTEIKAVKSLLRRARPNTLIVGSNAWVKNVLRWLAPFAVPICVCLLPGPLKLPTGSVATLVLDDVAALHRRQQLDVLQWMSQQSGVQVVSAAAAAVYPLVRAGQFEESLYYRLNEVMFDQASRRESD